MDTVNSDVVVVTTICISKELRKQLRELKGILDLNTYEQTIRLLVQSYIENNSSLK